MEKKDYLKYILHAAILIGLVVAGVKYLNGEEVLEAIRTFDYRYALVMGALALAYLFSKAWRFVLLTRQISDVPWGVIFKVYVAGQPAAYLPGGIAARAGLMKEVDIPVGKGSVPVIFNSLLDQVVLISGALIAALWFERARTSVLIIIGVIAALGVALYIPASRRLIMQVFERIAKKFNFLDQWEKFLEALPKAMSLRLFGITLGITILATVFQIITLDLAIRGVGATLSYSVLALAYFLPIVLGRLSGLPGGVGVTEAGMVGVLHTMSDLSTPTVFAAVAIFRLAVIVFTGLVGALVYFFMWRGEDEPALSAEA